MTLRMTRLTGAYDCFSIMMVVYVIIERRVFMPVRSPARKKTFRALLGALLVSSIVAAPMTYAASPDAKTSASGPNDPKEVEAFADQFFNQPQIKDQLTGATFVVVKDDQVLLKKGYGYADIAKKTPVDPDSTVFRIASISKSFTATAVMQLAEQGKIDLDQDIQSYLGDLRITNKTDQPLAMKHLLTHTTGFDYTEAAFLDNIPTDFDYPLDRFVKSYAPTVVRKPGEAYRYDNYGFSLQGYIVQNVSGQPFQQYVADHIFKPLGMNSTYFQITPENRDRLAVPYNAIKQPIDQYGSAPTISPGGGMLSTGGDMAKFMIAHLNGGKFGNERILKEETAKTMHQLQHGIHPKLPDGAYGFETFYQSHNNGQLVIGKGGDLPGFHSWMWLMPEKKVGGFIVFNRDGFDFREALYQAFMDHYYPKPAETKTDFKLSDRELARFTGVYRDLRVPLWTFQVKASKDGQLIVDDLFGNHKLRPIEPLLFEDEDGKQAGFKENPDGTVAFMYYNKPDSWAEKLPEPIPFRDVKQDNPYAESIYLMLQLGFIGESEDGLFHPGQPITRAEFIAWIMRATGISPSAQPGAFADLAGSPYAAAVQSAAALGIVKGTSEQAFEPDKPISRQEAATIVWRVAQYFVGLPPHEASLGGETDAWAVEGVKFVVAKGMYGPEVKPGEGGSVDYKSKQPMLRQEAAAMLNLFSKNLLLGG